MMIAMTNDEVCRAFERYGDMTFRIALNIVRNREEAQDVVMDTFLALQKQSGFEDENHIKAWLIRTSENKSLNVLRAARTRRNVPLDEVLEGALSSPMSTSELDLLDMVMRLPNKLKTTVYMFYYEDMSAEQIAAALKISENTVYKRLERGRKLLKISLEEAAI